MKLKCYFIFFVYQLTSYAQVEIIFNKNDLKSYFIDSTQLKEEGGVFDNSFIGNLKSIQIIKNEKINLALLYLVDSKNETRLEFCNIICCDNESFELEIDNSETSKYLVYKYFYLNNFKIIMCSNELSFYYFDSVVGMYILFLKIE